MVILLVIVIGLLLLCVGYGVSIATRGPLNQVLMERVRIQRETRLAELQVRHLTHEAMQRLMREARD